MPQAQPTVATFLLGSVDPGEYGDRPIGKEESVSTAWTSQEGVNQVSLEKNDPAYHESPACHVKGPFPANNRQRHTAED